MRPKPEIPWARDSERHAMKEIIANRRRLGLGGKLRLLRLVIRENDLLWTFFFGVYYLCSAVSDRAFRMMHRRAASKGLPGLNSAKLNREIWDNWDWEERGDEWTLSPEWKASLISNVLNRYIPPGMDILEIGPGGGRWTEYLQPRARFLCGVDISQRCVELCRIRFRQCPNVRFLRTEGAELTGVDDQSVDAIWSFDVFVHILREDVARYVREFRRVLRPGGVGVVHHGNGPSAGGWRSDLTAEEFRILLLEQGFTVLAQFDRWQDGCASFPVGLYNDVVTVFKR